MIMCIISTVAFAIIFIYETYVAVSADIKTQNMQRDLAKMMFLALASKNGRSMKTSNSKPFVVSEYFDRTEKVNREILAERDKADTYTLILWVGLYGLKLNQDGTTSWVTKEDKIGHSNYQLQHYTGDCIPKQGISDITGKRVPL